VILPDSSSFTYESDAAGRLTFIRETGQVIVEMKRSSASAEARPVNAQQILTSIIFPPPDGSTP